MKGSSFPNLVTKSPSDIKERKKNAYRSNRYLFNNKRHLLKMTDYNAKRMSMFRSIPLVYYLCLLRRLFNEFFDLINFILRNQRLISCTQNR